ncbi:hypothetical protein I4U23_015752 [Adineta vaga]|nr:hypothetical protein I4U23_015752 [Adineta vaga]
MATSIDEYTPTDVNDPLLLELCRLFIDSFYNYYQFIVPELNLSESKQVIPTLGQSLEKTMSFFSVHSSFKRQGFGSLFMHYLKENFGSTMTYEVLTRRVNQPALQFYSKYNPLIMNDERTVNYGYDPKDFIGFRLTAI